MMKLVRQIADDEGAMKALFDHVRNLAVTSVVFGAAVWRYKNAGDGISFYFNVAISATLVVFGVFLYLVNQRHGLARLREAKYERWVFSVVLGAYALVTMNILFSLVRGAS
jgi:hypothetical protein